MKCEDNILWLEYFSLFKTYLKNNNGEYPKKGHSLYNWMRTQRSIYKTVEKEKKEGKIIPDYVLARIAKLKENDFIFEPKVIRPKWQRNFELLKQYLIDNGGNYPVDGDLYKWIDNQRIVHEKGKRKNGIMVYKKLFLTAEEEKKLYEINFDWGRTTIWTKNLALLKQYLDEHEGGYPKRGERYRQVHLYKWINHQRTIFNNGIKQEDGSIVYGTWHLTKKQIDLLNGINFSWTGKRKTVENEHFTNKFTILKQYLKEHNGAYPLRGEIYCNLNLYNWISHIRSIFNNGKVLEDGAIMYNNYRLTMTQIELLNSINFIWVVKKNLALKEQIKDSNDMKRKQLLLYCELEKALLINKQKKLNDVKDMFVKILE